MNNFPSKDTVKRIKRQTTYEEKICVNHESCRGFVFIIYKELLKKTPHNYKKTTS